MIDFFSKQRQVAYWRLIGAAFGLQEMCAPFERMITELAAQLDLPPALLDEKMSIDILLNRHPNLRPHFEALKEITAVQPNPADMDEADLDEPPPAPEKVPPPDLVRTLVFSKLILNVFGPATLVPQCSAQQYSQWCDDVTAFEKCFGFAPGSLRPGGGGAPALIAGGGSGAGISGHRELIGDEQLRAELIAMESDLVKRMELREVLKDDRLAAQLTPSLSLVEQLLYDKTNLSGSALKNARVLIRKYVDDLAEVLKKQVARAPRGKVDRSVPPKRIFRNLDVKRTVWKNLHHFHPDDGRVYVDQLFYRHSAQKSLTNYLIVVVDQSGSMVDAMVQCAILASIFATLPRVKVSLIAFDTNVIDLTEHVTDPFEVLMRTNLGGGNDGPKAMVEARQKIVDARKTTMVWISDFYEFQNDRPLFEMIKAVKESGVHFIPVGSVSGSGYFSVNEWFRKQLKEIGLPVLTGNIRKLIVELKQRL